MRAKRPSRKVAAGTIEAGVVYDIGYYCDTPGPEIDSGMIRGYWTGEIDWTGKLTIQDAAGGPTLYLFPREFTDLDPIAPRDDDARWHAGFADVDPIAYRNLGRTGETTR
jgi:hypothetical protein